MLFQHGYTIENCDTNYHALYQDFSQSQFLSASKKSLKIYTYSPLWNKIRSVISYHKLVFSCKTVNN